MEQARYTLTYRATEARQVMGWIKAGQSGCLVGLRGAGKSNFLRFLLRQDVRQRYLGPDCASFVFVLVDLLALVERTEWAVYELMLDRLLGMEDASEETTSLRREVMRSREPLPAQRAVERCVNILCRRPAQRIVLFLDEFDALFRTFDPSLFRCLRAIRDAHKGQVSYVVVTTDDLGRLRDDMTQVDHFYRLVSRNTCDLGPYNEADARQMIRFLASRRSIELTTGDTAHLVELSGGHASLLKAILSLLWDVHQDGSGSTELQVLAEIAPALKDEAVIQAECQKVWVSLPASEQSALRALTTGAQADPHTLCHLKRQGLVREGQPEFSLFSPLFTDFVRREATHPNEGVVISRSPRKVQIEGRRIENLSELEFEMLCYLYEHRGRVCTKNELIENVYGYGVGVSDEALQALISRLRRKIEPDRKLPRYIVTVRPLGYKLVEPGDE